MPIFEHVVVAEDNSFPGKGGTALTTRINTLTGNKLEALVVGTVTTGTAGSNASVSITGTAPNQTINFTIPTGPAGTNGQELNLTAGTPTLLTPGSTPTVSITGTFPNRVLGLGIPQGAAGSNGTRGTIWNVSGQNGITTATSSVTGMITGDVHLNATTGAISRYSGSAWVASGSIQGPKGDTGNTGLTGTRGSLWYIQGQDGITSTASVTTPLAGDVYLVPATGAISRYSGSAWVASGSIQGPKGDTGNTGPDGRSAYQVAVANGYTGTEAEWLASLKGADGTGTATSTYPEPLQQYNLRVYSQRLPKWSAAIDQVKSGVRDAKILCIGDSTTAGIGGNTAASSSYFSSWPTFMVSELNKLGIETVDGLQVPGSNTVAVDTRWTTDNYTKTGLVNVGFGNKNMYFTGTGTLTFKDPRIFADRFTVYYVRVPGGDTTHISATATGGTAVTKPLRGLDFTVGYIDSVTCSAATASFNNSVNITRANNTTSTPYVIAVEPWLSTGSRVRIGNAAASGSNSGGWATPYTTTAPLHEWASDGSIKAYAPDLTIFDIGINDASGTTGTDSATFQANVQKIIDAASVSGDVILKTMIPSNADTGTRIANEDRLVGVLRSMGYPVLDTYAQYGTYAKSNAAGLMSDNLHGNEKMYLLEGRDIARSLPTTGSGSGSTSSSANTPFMVRYTGTAWEFDSLASAQAAGLNPAQTIWFIGNPGGSMPAWARPGDIWTQG